jgi:hypothetical protein
MIPNIHIHERLMVEHHQERQQEMAHYRQAKEALRNRPGRGSRLVAHMGTLLLAMRTHQSRLESVGKKAGYEHSSI